MSLVGSRAASQLNPAVVQGLDDMAISSGSPIQLTRRSSSVFEQADAEGDDEHRQRQR